MQKYFGVVYDKPKNIEIFEGYCYPKRKMRVTMHVFFRDN